VPFAITSVAQAAALASLEPQAEAQLLARVHDIAAERDRVRAALTDLGYPVPPSQANFIWLPLADQTTEFAAGCEERKVIVRPFAGDGVRVTIGTPEENERFLTAAADLRSLVRSALTGAV
jgi:histidinol-phosphate aminotransferase